MCGNKRIPGIREYEVGDGWTVLVGMSDRDNEHLSLKIAGQNDWWFHVSGMPGSHVLLTSRPGQEPGREVLKQVAAIAAYHSKARAGGVVSVSCTRARYVTRFRGAPTGTVRIRRETVFKVRPKVPDHNSAGMKGTDDETEEQCNSGDRR